MNSEDRCSKKRQQHPEQRPPLHGSFAGVLALMEEAVWMHERPGACASGRWVMMQGNRI